MENIDNIHHFKIYVEAEKISSNRFEFVWDNRNIVRSRPEYDFYIPIFLNRSSVVHDYVQIDIDDTIKPIIRQDINPFFYEYSFFDGIKKNKVLESSDLTNAMINRIREVRPDVSTFTNNEIKNWFDRIGINEFPWNPGTPQKTTQDDLDVIRLNPSHIISKANYFNIDINK